MSTRALESGLSQARRLFARLYAAGVDYDDVVAALEREGIEKFVSSFGQIVKRIADKRRELVAARGGRVIPGRGGSKTALLHLAPGCASARSSSLQ